METGLEVEEPDDREPEDLPRWLEAGFTKEAAELWGRWRFSIARARAWEGAGVTDGLQAAQWSTARVTPATVEEWRSAGIDAAEAVRWHEFGYGLGKARMEKAKGIGPDQAFAATHQAPHATTFPGSGGMTQRVRNLSGGMLAAGPWGTIDPRLRHSYVERQWHDCSAAEWARRGIWAADAYLWHDLGLTAAEAGRLHLQGRTVGDVIREWWSAGIPFEELADWIGAGLSAEEAVEQRNRGITVEHAASLRALRQDDPPGPAESEAPELGAGGGLRMGNPRIEQHGPPPEDEMAARTAINEAYAQMGEVDENVGNVPSVEGSEGLAIFQEHSKQRVDVQFGHVPQVDVTFTVELIRFVNDHEAVISYTADISGELQITLAGRPGRAMLVDGEWKVARETYCDWVRTGGIECPPRGDPNL